MRSTASSTAPRGIRLRRGWPARPFRHAHTYILECSDGSYYVGSTTDLDARLWQHNSDGDGPLYTRSRRPVVLRWNSWFDSILEAFEFEKRVQGWSRKKREALIRGDYDHLPALSRRKAVQERERRAEGEDG